MHPGVPIAPSSPGLQTIEPFHHILFIFPLQQLIQLRIIGDYRLHVLDEASLYASPSGEIQMKINHGGLDVLVPQTVFDLGDVPAPGKQIHGPSVPEGVYRVDIYQTFGRKDFGQILSADTVYAMPGEFFSPLTDKDPVLVQGPGIASVSVDIDLEKFCGFVLKIYEPEPVSLPEDGEVFFLGVEVIQIQGGDL